MSILPHLHTGQRWAYFLAIALGSRSRRPPEVPSLWNPLIISLSNENYSLRP